MPENINTLKYILILNIITLVVATVAAVLSFKAYDEAYSATRSAWKAEDEIQSTKKLVQDAVYFSKQSAESSEAVYSKLSESSSDSKVSERLEKFLR